MRPLTRMFCPRPTFGYNPKIDSSGAPYLDVFENSTFPKFFMGRENPWLNFELTNTERTLHIEIRGPRVFVRNTASAVFQEYDPLQK